MSDTDQPDNAADDAGLTKQKKPRSEAQIATFEKMRAAKASKRAAAEPAPIPDKERKKMILKAVKEKLNGDPKPEVVDETESESDDEPEPPPPKKSHKKKVEPPPPVKAKKEPKVVYEEDSDTEEEVVIVKKKRKKPKKKTIIYEESTSEDEPEPEPPKKAAQPSRETKSQQNSKSLFKITPGKAEAPKPIYYFAD
jgi:hypothetical protein